MLFLLRNKAHSLKPSTSSKHTLICFCDLHRGRGTYTAHSSPWVVWSGLFCWKCTLPMTLLKRGLLPMGHCISRAETSWFQTVIKQIRGNLYCGEQTNAKPASCLALPVCLQTGLWRWVREQFLSHCLVVVTRGGQSSSEAGPNPAEL